MGILNRELRIKDRLWILVLSILDISLSFFPKIGKLGKRSGRILIATVGRLLLVPFVAPVLWIQERFPATDPILTPLLWIFQGILYHGPLFIWNTICTLLDWVVKWIVILLLGLVSLVVYLFIQLAHRLVNPGLLSVRLPAPQTPIRILQLGIARILFYVVGAILLVFVIISQITLWLGTQFSRIDSIFDSFIGAVISESDIKEARDNVYHSVLAKVQDGELETYADSRQRIIDDAKKRRTEAKENISRGEFLLSILLVILSLGLTFAPGLADHLLYNGRIFNYAIRLDVLFIAQLSLAVLTALLLVSVVIRTQLIDYLTYDDFSDFNGDDRITAAAEVNAEAAVSPIAVVYSVYWKEDRDEVIRGRSGIEQKAAELGSLRDTLLYYIKETITLAKEVQDAQASGLSPDEYVRETYGVDPSDFESQMKVIEAIRTNNSDE